MNGGHMEDMIRLGSHQKRGQRIRFGGVHADIGKAGGIEPAGVFLQPHADHFFAAFQKNIRDKAAVLPIHTQHQRGFQVSKLPSRDQRPSMFSSIVPVTSAWAIAASRLSALTTEISGSGKIMLVPAMIAARSRSRNSRLKCHGSTR